MADSKSSLRAIVLAAGQGKRMKSQLPKVLHEVLGRTILGRVLFAVDALSVEKVHVIVGHASDQVREFLKKNPPSSALQVHLQEPQLGTGHAVMQAADALKDFHGTLIVTVGDTPLLSADTLKHLIQKHQEDQATVTVLTAEVDDPLNYGRIIRDGKGAVARIIEDKDASAQEKLVREINTAIYCLEWPSVHDGLQSLTNDNRQKEYYLTDLIAWANEKKLRVSAVKVHDWRETSGINSRLELTAAIDYMRTITLKKLSLKNGVTIVDPLSTFIAPEVEIGQDTVILPGCYLMGEVKIGSNCSIGPNTTVSGPAFIGDDSTVNSSVITNSIVGKNCKIGPFSHLREGSDVKDNSRVGNFVELKNSIIGPSTNASHLSYVGDCTVGKGSNVGAGTITANYDHITKQKARTIIGDNVSIGSNSVLVAPVEIRHGASVGAGSVITKDVPAGALALTRAPLEIKEDWVEEKRKRAAAPKA